MKGHGSLGWKVELLLRISSTEPISPACPTGHGRPGSGRSHTRGSTQVKENSPHSKAIYLQEQKKVAVRHDLFTLLKLTNPMS